MRICKYVTGEKCEDVEDFEDVWRKRVWRGGCEDEEECKEVVKMNMSYKMYCELIGVY